MVCSKNLANPVSYRNDFGVKHWYTIVRNQKTGLKRSDFFITVCKFFEQTTITIKNTSAILVIGCNFSQTLTCEKQ